MIIIRLKGGLGNTLFQYLAGLSLSEKLCSKVYFDCVTGFRKDKYGRELELVIPKYRRLSTSASFISLLASKLNLGGYFFNKFVDCSSIDPVAWVNYGDSDFQELPDSPHNELKIDALMAIFGKKIKLNIEPTSLSIGFRSYQETSDPKIYAKDGKPVCIEDFFMRIDLILDRYDLGKIILFSLDKNFLEQAYKRYSKQYLVVRGPVEPKEAFREFGKSGVAVFNNSTYYFMAAFLFNMQGYCTNNFVYESLNSVFPDLIEIGCVGQGRGE